MRNKGRILLVIIFLMGVVTPFISAFVVIEAFFLIIPFVLIFVGTLIFLILSLIYKKANTQAAIFIFSILPTFLLAQLLAVLTIDRFQRIRSQILIEKVEKYKTDNGDFPSAYSTSLGIHYEKLKDEKGFTIEYSRGFRVREKYHSSLKRWKSYGWTD